MLTVEFNSLIRRKTWVITKVKQAKITNKQINKQGGIKRSFYKFAKVAPILDF